MIKSYMRGNPIYFDGEQWKYSEDNTLANDSKPCTRCGHMPTECGYDNCLGYIDGATNACCGHGVSDMYTMTEDGYNMDNNHDILLAKIERKRINTGYYDKTPEQILQELQDAMDSFTAVSDEEAKLYWEAYEKVRGR